MTLSPRSHARGFTLVEVVFTLVLLGIVLIAIVPRLTSGRETSRDGDAQSSLEAVMNAQAQILLAQGKVSDGADGFMLLKSYQPEVNYLEGRTASVSPEDVSVFVTAQLPDPTAPQTGPLPQTVTLAALGGQGSCFYLRQTFTGRVPGRALHGIRDAGGPGTCRGDSAVFPLSSPGSQRGASWSEPLEVG